MTSRPAIWIVSLERAHDRRAFVSQAFAKLGLDFEIFDAVDGQSLTAADRKMYSEWRALYQYGRGLSPGNLGCSLSHLRAYDRMLREGHEWIAIFEDDVEPMPDLVDVLGAVNKLPSDWEIVTLHSLFQSARSKPIGSQRIAGSRHVCTYERTPFGTQGYLITRAGAQRALRVGYPICLPADELLYRRHPAGLVVYGIEPTVLVHREFESEIRRTTEPVSNPAAFAAPARVAVRAAGVLRRRALRQFAGGV